MEEKKKQCTKTKGRKILWLIGIIIVLAAVAVIVAKSVGDTTEQEKPLLKIHTPYIELCLPLELESIITYDESTYGVVYTRAFYLNYAGEEWPLWRLDFGDPNAGEWLGMLKTDQGDIPMCMTGFVVDVAALGEDGAKVYGECMQGYSEMLNGIMSDSRFTLERPLAVGEDTNMAMTYWTVVLPDTMRVSETTENGNYEAVFSAEVVGEMVRLYRVCIGENQAESLLGYYEVDGVKKPVSVGSFDLVERDSWAEDDYAAAYRMMDTINHVIDTIMQSKQFSTEAE